MAEPGWYNAAGDPAGTQRYWDGSQWLGDAVYEPTGIQPVASVPPPAPGYAYAGTTTVVASTFPTGVKVVAIILSVLKAVPIVFGILALVVLTAAARDFNDEFDDIGIAIGGIIGATVFIFVIIALSGILLLGFQFVGALKEHPMMVFVPALIMSLLDGLFTVGAWASWNDSRNSPFGEESPAGAVLMSVIFIAQAYVAVQALRANNK